MIQIAALRSRLEKQPTDLRRSPRDLGDGALVQKDLNAEIRRRGLELRLLNGGVELSLPGRNKGDGAGGVAQALIRSRKPPKIIARTGSNAMKSCGKPIDTAVALSSR